MRAFYEAGADRFKPECQDEQRRTGEDRIENPSPEALAASARLGPACFRPLSG
jgi:hypothetical protein